ncbi:MAG: membrane protein insertion efficiency factor YidD [Cycloclasticus sp.]
MLARRCRFYPTCSEYALEAFQEYSAIKAFHLTLKRLFRCHPFCKGGVDPLPTSEKSNG